MSALQIWLERHDACIEGKSWAMATGCQTIQEIWQRNDLPPDWRIWIATRKGMVEEKKLRLFACRCVREIWHLLKDLRSKQTVEVAERFAAGEATDAELAAAWDAAWAAASDAGGGATRAAAWTATNDVAAIAALAAANDATRAAAKVAIGDAAWTAMRAVAAAAAWAAAWAVVDDAAWAAAWTAAWAAAAAAAWAAAWATAAAAEWLATKVAANKKQAEILLEIVPTLQEVQP